MHSAHSLFALKGKELAECPAGTACRDLHRGCRQVVHAPCCVSEVTCPDRRQYMHVVFLPHHHTSALVPNAAFWISFLPSPSRREAAGRQGERLVTIFAGQEHIKGTPGYDRQFQKTPLYERVSGFGLHGQGGQGRTSEGGRKANACICCNVAV